MADGSPERESKSLADGGPPRCPRCGTAWPAGTRRCAACGFDAEAWFDEERLYLGTRWNPSTVVLGVALTMLVLFYLLGLLVLATST